MEVASWYALLADEIGIVLAERTPPIEAGFGMDGPIKVDGIGMLRGVGIDGYATRTAATSHAADGILRAGIPT